MKRLTDQLKKARARVARLQVTVIEEKKRRREASHADIRRRNERRKAALKMKRQGFPLRQIAKELGVSPATICADLKRKASRAK